jgi:hypothetical protein
MKSHLCALPRMISAQSSKSERKLGLAAAISIPVLLSFCLILCGRAASSAAEHRHLEWQRSAILPPPKEAPPPPPPTENLIEYGESSRESSGTVTLCNAAAEPWCGNILELPTSVFFPRHRSLALYRQHKAVRGLEQDREHCEYSEDHARWVDSQADQPPMGYYSNLKVPPEETTPVDPARGGFIPLNPRGITVRPGERSPIPPTSPLLTTPPGSAARPYVWRP